MGTVSPVFSPAIKVQVRALAMHWTGLTGLSLVVINALCFISSTRAYTRDLLSTLLITVVLGPVSPVIMGDTPSDLALCSTGLKEAAPSGTEPCAKRMRKLRGYGADGTHFS